MQKWVNQYSLSRSLIDSREEEIGEVEVGRLRSTMSYEYYSSSHDRSSDTVLPSVPVCFKA